jgi:hypothetical protein
MPDPLTSCFREISGASAAFRWTAATGCWLADAVITGAQLAEAFYTDVVGPLLARDLPSVRHAAGRLGSGSDVLGYDDAMSRDHDWGCRLTLLVDSTDSAAVPHIRQLLADRLPQAYAGHPVRFPVTWDQTSTHKVEVATVNDFAFSRLGVRPPLDTLDWLVPSGQGVLEVIGGPVFVDGTRELGPLREGLLWYPPDVDRFTIASAWSQIAQRLHMVGRTAERGQDLQSRLLCAHIADRLVRLAFLVHRQWMPYAKWREARLRTLPGADRLCILLAAALGASSWQDREQALADAAELLLAIQRGRGLPAPDHAVGPFFDRPFRTVNESVVRLLLEDVADDRLRRLPGVGGAEHWIDNDEVLADPSLRAASLAAYRTWLGA